MCVEDFFVNITNMGYLCVINYMVNNSLEYIIYNNYNSFSFTFNAVYSDNAFININRDNNKIINTNEFINLLLNKSRINKIKSLKEKI